MAQQEQTGSTYWDYNAKQYGKTMKERYDAKSQANRKFLESLDNKLRTKLAEYGIDPNLFATAGGNMDYTAMQKGVDALAELLRNLNYTSGNALLKSSKDWSTQRVASGVLDNDFIKLLTSGAVKVTRGDDGSITYEDANEGDDIPVTKFKSSVFKAPESTEDSEDSAKKGPGDKTDTSVVSTTVTPTGKTIQYTTPFNYTDLYGSRHFGKNYMNTHVYNNKGYGLKRGQKVGNVPTRDLDLYALMRDAATTGSDNSGHYFGRVLRQSLGYTQDEDLSSVEKRDEVLARLYNTFGVRGRLGAYDRGRLRRDIEKYLRSKEAAEGKAWGYYYTNTNTDGNMDGYIDNTSKKAHGGILKSPFDYSTPITRFQKGGAMKNQNNISPKEKEELTKAFLAWAESKDIPKEKLIQVMQIAENPNSDPKQRKAATEQIQTLYEQFIAEMQQSQQQTQAQVAAFGAKLNYVNKLRRLQVGGALDMVEEGAFDKTAELQTQFISWLMDAQGLSEEEAVSFLDELMSGQYSEEEVAPILDQFYEDLESIQGYKKGGKVPRAILKTTAKNKKRYPHLTEDQCAGRAPIIKNGKEYYMNGDGKMLPVDKCGGRVKKHQEGGQVEKCLHGTSMDTQEQLTRMVPFYGTYKDFQDGNYGSGVINGVGDLLILGGAGAIGRRAKNLAKAKSLLKAEQSAKAAFDKFSKIGNEAYSLATKLGKKAREQANLALERNYEPTLRTHDLQQYNSAMEYLAQELSLIRRRYPYTWDLVAPTGNFFVNYSNALRAMTRGEAADRAANIAKRKVAQYSNALKRVDNRPFSPIGKILLTVPQVATKAASRMVSELSGESDNMQTK